MTQIKETKQNKTERQISDLEITNPHEKDFILMIVKIIQHLINKLEAKIDKLQEILSKEIQNLRIKQAKMQKYNN